MAPADPLQRRIKQHVAARSHDFFAIAGPGLEALCLEEIASRIAESRTSDPSEGGIAFKARLHDAYAVNLWSATASRVLMRIGTLSADGFRKLKRRVSDFPWELYLPAGTPMHVNVALHHSRLYHKDAVADCLREGIENRFEAQGLTLPADPGPQDTQTLYARAIDNRFTLSLDMSGEHLHKRGLKVRAGKAPLRETLAAAVLKLAGYQGDDLLLDPMCGSGTFSLEAAMMSKRIPPGWFRSFAFEKWPAFQPGRWTHLRREAEQGFRNLPAPIVLASDRKAAMVGGLKETVRAGGMEDAVRVRRADFFDLIPEKDTGRRGLVVLNPPYGLRLDTPQESLQLYREIGVKLRRDFSGWRAAVLSPDPEPDEQLQLPGRRHFLFHGGLRLLLCISDIT
ncbi:MAG: THUMP domain-containing class I SAM-dependent RNA methyltransferase [Desulfobacterales bacterium]